MGDPPLIPMIQATSSRAVVAAAARRGVDADRLLAAHAIAQDRWSDPDLRLPADQVLRLWADAARLSAEPELAVLAAVEMPWGAYRVVDYLCGHTATLGEAVTALTRVFGIVNDGVHLSVRPAPDGGAILGLHGRRGPIPTAYVDYALTACVYRMSYAIGGPVHARITLRRGPPGDRAAHHRAFGPSVTFDADDDEAWFEPALWATPTLTPDPVLREVLEHHAATVLRGLAPAEPVDPLVAEVRDALERELPSGHAELDRIASRIGTSRRTLQRRLGELGLSWRELLEDTRLALARRHLTERALSIEEIAVLLGYADTSGFHRAFVRATGTTPGAWRHGGGAI